MLSFRFSNIGRIIRAILVVAGVVIELNAQPAASPPARTEVSFMSWENDQEGLFITTNDRDYSVIAAPAYEFGQPVPVRAQLPVRIHEQVKTADGIAYVVVGEGTLPPGCRTAHVYLIRMADQDGHRSYRVIALSADTDAFAAGKVRLFNFTPYPAAIRVNDTPMNLPSLEWVTMDAAPDRKHRVVLRAALELPEGGWTPAVRGLVTLRENFRGSVTLLHTRRAFDETNSAILPEARMFIQAISEYVHPKPQPATPAPLANGR